MSPTRAQRVFVDANIWISWGYQLNKAEASTLAELVEHDLASVVVTDLTTIEIAKRFRDIDFEKLEPLVKPDVRALTKKHLDIDLPNIDRETLRADLFEHHLKSVQDRLSEQFKAEVLSIDKVKPTYVLAQYTEGRGLFGPTGKKNQFPDAFIFAAIANDATDKNPLIVLSQDGDFANACDREPNIRRVTSMSTLLEALGLQPERQETIALVMASPERFNNGLIQMLNDFGVEADDIEDAEIEVLDILKVENLQLSALYRISEEENTFIGFGRCTTRVTAGFTHPDWDTAIWDSEDKVPIPLHIVKGENDIDIDDVTFSFLVDINHGEVENIYGCEIISNRSLRTQLQPDWHD